MKPTVSIVPPKGKLYVHKRDGRKETIHFDKITSRIQKLCYGLNSEFVDPLEIAMKVITGLFPGVTTAELDNLAAEIAASMTTRHPDYAILAARIAISNLHKETKKIFSDVITDLYNIENEYTGKRSPMISDYHYDIIMKNTEKLNSSIIYDRDFNYNYFGFKTLEKSYLLKIKGKVAERPQHMLMRVAVGIHGEDIDAAIETYNMMSEKYFTHASPTLFSSGTQRPQLSSCFLIAMKEDSIEGIFNTLTTCALISKSAGGVGLHIHNIRAANSYIAGTNGVSNGLVPMLRVFNNVARYVDQGGNKRPGAFAIYLEPWHADIFEFLELRKNTGKEEIRARDLFFALWIPDEFMRRVEENGTWSLMCPNQSLGLSDVYGEEFDKLYKKYENEGRFVRQVEARKLWFAILDSQIETGTPYMLYKDSCNLKSNQKNLGVIKSSNLCTEIIEYSAPDEVAVCNLASIAVNMFVRPDRSYDFKKLKEITKIITKNLNKIIDINYYPVPEAKKSNLRHRPIGIGIQGLADMFILMKLPYESEKSQLMNIQIFETIYYGALEASCELAERDGPYETYEGCPVSKGILQYDMWNVKPTSLWDWDALKEKIKKYGVRNSLLLAPMPTASTAQILGNNESFEPYTSNIYTRRVLSGEFQIVNNHLLKDLVERGLWDEDMKNELILNNGSVQNISAIPDDLKELYKTVWEIKQKTVLKMAADRSAFIDQSQSLNIHIAEPTYSKLTSMHFYGWKLGLKTGMYYLRTRPAADAIKFTVDKTKAKSAEANGVEDSSSEEEEKEMLVMACSRANGPDCAMCSESSPWLKDRSAIVEAIVLYEYTSQESDELTLRKGDIVTDIQIRDGGWWEGTSKDGKRGLFPDNFVKTISENFTVGSSETALRGKKFLVKFNYSPVNIDELELKVGDVVELISEIEEGWWEGRLNNKIGVFPSNFVSEITEPKIDSKKDAADENDCQTVSSRNEIIPDTEKMEVDESRTSPNVSITNDAAPVLPPKPKPVKEMCVALFPYEAKHDDELTLKENDTILLLSTDLPDKGWWKGQLNGKIGVFPDNFVKLITLSDDVDKPRRPSVTKTTTNKIRDNMSNKQATNSNVAALRKSLETPVKPSDESIASPSKKPTVSKKPGFSPSSSSDAIKNLFATSSPLEKGTVSPDHNASSRNFSISDSSPSLKSNDSDVRSWIEATDDSRKTRLPSSSVNDKLNAELQNSFVSREMDNTMDNTDGSSASKNSATANNSDNCISNHDFDMKEKGKEIDLNVVERSEVLTHPTAFRAKAPKRRPPSGINFKDDDVPAPNNKIHNSKIMINGNASQKSAPWLQELKMNQMKKNSSQVNIRSGFTGSGSNVTFRFQRPVSMFSCDAEAQSLSFQSKSLPPSNESVVPAVTSTSISDAVTSSSFEKVVTISVNEWNALLEKVNSLEIRLEKQNEYYTKTLDQLKSKLASEVSLRVEMKHEIEKLIELVTQV